MNEYELAQSVLMEKEKLEEEKKFNFSFFLSQVFVKLGGSRLIKKRIDGEMEFSQLEILTYDSYAKDRHSWTIEKVLLNNNIVENKHLRKN